MSLKQFHIVFIIMAVLTSAGFSAWAFTRHQTETGVLLMGGTSAVAAVGLMIYGFWFLKKLKGQMDS
jgi:hypothetical protein